MKRKTILLFIGMIAILFGVGFTIGRISKDNVGNDDNVDNSIEYNNDTKEQYWIIKGSKVTSTITNFNVENRYNDKIYSKVGEDIDNFSKIADSNKAYVEELMIYLQDISNGGSIKTYKNDGYKSQISTIEGNKASLMKNTTYNTTYGLSVADSIYLECDYLTNCYKALDTGNKKVFMNNMSKLIKQNTYTMETITEMGDFFFDGAKDELIDIYEDMLTK